MNVGEACNRKPVTARPDDTARDAAKAMKNLGIGSLIVVGEDDRPVGMVTDRDIVQKVIRRRRDPDKTTLREVMNEDLTTVWEGAVLERAFHRMRQEEVRRVIVTDDEGRVSGIITVDDALPLITRELGVISEVLDSQRPDTGP